MRLDHSFATEVRFFAVFAGLIVLSLLAGMPAHAQGVPVASDLDIITDAPQSTMTWLIVFLVAQILVLWGVMLSYLHFAGKLNKERHTPVHSRWSRLLARH